MGIANLITALAGLLPFAFLVGVCLLRFAEGADRPRALVDAFLAWIIVGYASSELLGRFHLIAFYPALAVWCVAVGVVGYRIWRVGKPVRGFWQWQNTLPFWVVAAFLAVTLFIALTTAPNNWDSQTYHLPRIEHWIQNGSLEFYPTFIPRQNDYGPLAETLLLQTRVLAGTDLFYPLIQWVSMLGALAAVFRVARQLGGSDTQCWLAALFLATLPIGILESTSTQNDYVVAALLTCFVTLGLEAIAQPRASLGLVLVATAAVGLSGIAKPIGYLFGAGFAVWFAIELSRKATLDEWFGRVAGALVVLALTMAPSATRYMAAHGGAQSDLARVAANGSFGIKQTLDNLIRDAMLNFNTGIPRIDAATNGAVGVITARLGLDTYRADTTEVGQPFSQPPVGLYVFHEDNGPNPVHAILVVIAMIMVLARWPTAPTRLQLVYWGAWLFGIVAFAAIVRWNPYQIRYHLPAFALIAPAAALVWPLHWAQSRKLVALCLVLALIGVPNLLLNQARELVPIPRVGPLQRDRPSYLAQTRLEQLFVNQPQLLVPYRNAIDLIARSNASQIGLVLGSDSWEYPIWSMLRDHRLDRPIRIEHVGPPGAQRWPRGPFSPDVLFWNAGDAPPTFSVNGQEFLRLGPPGTIAVYTRAALAVGPMPVIAGLRPADIADLRTGPAAAAGP